MMCNWLRQLYYINVKREKEKNYNKHTIKHFGLARGLALLETFMDSHGQSYHGGVSVFIVFLKLWGLVFKFFIIFYALGFENSNLKFISAIIL